MMRCLAASRLTMNSPSWSLSRDRNPAGGKALVDGVAVLGVQAKATVIDLRDQAGANPVRPDLDPRVGRREDRRVLHELSDEVDGR